MVGFLPCPIFSAQSLHPRVDFQCHNPVTLACSVWVWYFNLVVARLYGAWSSPSPPQWSLHVNCEEKRNQGFNANTQTKRIGAQGRTENRWHMTAVQCYRQPAGCSAVVAGQISPSTEPFGPDWSSSDNTGSITVSATFCEAAHKHCWLYGYKIFIRGFTNRMIKLPCDCDLAAEA